MTDVWSGRHDVRVYETATGSGALSVNISYLGAFQLEELRIHCDSAPVASENLTITVDAAAGSQYDCLIKSIPMAGVTNYVWIPDPPALFVRGDVVNIAWTNTNTVTWGLTYVYRRVN